jgi:antitoxin component YwqK of YwqJK toxin-antitoxin module
MNQNLFTSFIKLPFLSLLLLVSANSNAQKIEKFFDYKWKECMQNSARFYCVITKTDSGYHRNDYFIHEKRLQMSGFYEDVDCKIPNGHFQYYHANGVVQSVGNYLHGKREGLWLGFHNNKMMSDSTFYLYGKPLGTSIAWYPNGYPLDSVISNADGSGIEVTWFDNGMISSVGRYSTGVKKEGKWKFFHNNGKLSALEIYHEGFLVDKSYFDEEGNNVKDTVNNDRPANFPGGMEAWRKYVMQGLYFPDQYQIVNSDSAIVVVSFTINENGNVENVFTSTPFYRGFDEIAEKVIRKSPKWSPAIQHNRRVKNEVKQVVIFAQKTIFY